MQLIDQHIQRWGRGDVELTSHVLVAGRIKALNQASEDDRLSYQNWLKGRKMIFKKDGIIFDMAEDWMPVSPLVMEKYVEDSFDRFYWAMYTSAYMDFWVKLFEVVSEAEHTLYNRGPAEWQKDPALFRQCFGKISLLEIVISHPRPADRYVKLEVQVGQNVWCQVWRRDGRVYWNVLWGEAYNPLKELVDAGSDNGGEAWYDLPAWLAPDPRKRKSRYQSTSPAYRIQERLTGAF